MPTGQNTEFPHVLAPRFCRLGQTVQGNYSTERSTAACQLPARLNFGPQRAPGCDAPHTGHRFPRGFLQACRYVFEWEAVGWHVSRCRGRVATARIQFASRSGASRAFDSYYAAAFQGGALWVYLSVSVVHVLIKRAVVSGFKSVVALKSLLRAVFPKLHVYDMCVLFLTWKFALICMLALCFGLEFPSSEAHFS